MRTSDRARARPRQRRGHQRPSAYCAASAAALINNAAGGSRGRPPATATVSHQGTTLGGGLLSAFAVGCPVCNKLVVLALGVNGALSWFAPVQPVLAVVSLGLLGYALKVRVRTLRTCRLAAPATTAEV